MMLNTGFHIGHSHTFLCKVSVQIFCLYFPGCFKLTYRSALHNRGVGHLSDLDYEHFFSSVMAFIFVLMVVNLMIRSFQFLKSKWPVFKIVSAFCVLKNHCLPEVYKGSHCFFSFCFLKKYYRFGFYIEGYHRLELTCVCCELEVEDFVFIWLFVPAQFIENAFPTELSRHLYWESVDCVCAALFLDFLFHWCLSILMPIPHYFD